MKNERETTDVLITDERRAARAGNKEIHDKTKRSSHLRSSVHSFTVLSSQLVVSSLSIGFKCK